MAMAERKQDRRELSRLQRRAPALLQINRDVEWNVAIPLLSPLIASPDRTAEIGFACCSNDRKDEARKSGNGLEKKAAAPEAAAVVFKKWQAAPFCYEPAPLVPFVCGGGVDR